MNRKYRRIKHFDDKLEAHFLTFSCFHQLPLLSKDRTRQWFIRAVDNARNNHAFELWAWVIMPDHAHLLIWPSITGYSTASILKSIKGSVGGKAINYLKKHAPGYLQKLKMITGNKVEYHFWQDGPGYDGNLDETRGIHETIDYIHNNPVRKGLVPTATDWAWSSARAWAGDLHPVLSIDRGHVPNMNE